MAEYLGIEFIDAQDVIFFNEEGNLNPYKTERVLGARLAEASRAVIPGFYGLGKDGNVKTFSRGGVLRILIGMPSRRTGKMASS